MYNVDVLINRLTGHLLTLKPNTIKMIIQDIYIIMNTLNSVNHRNNNILIILTFIVCSFCTKIYTPFDSRM